MDVYHEEEGKEASQYLATASGRLQGVSWPVCVNLTQNWQQEGGRLTGACETESNHRTHYTRALRFEQPLNAQSAQAGSVRSRQEGPRGCVPVWAQAIRSLLDLMMGMAYFWTGVGRV